MSANNRKRIVLIDDDADLRRTVMELLTRGGYEVESTGVPSEAADLIKRFDPCLVLCDIEMPEMSGYDVIKLLQSDFETASYPVVFLTAHQEFSERVRAFRYGVVDYITKPFTQQMLLRKIDRVVESFEKRSGEIRGSGLEARAIIEDLEREARTGVLTLTGEKGTSRLVLRAGARIEESGRVEDEADLRAEFCELDPKREEIVPHTTAESKDDCASIPSFTTLPEVFRNVLLVDDNDEFRSYLAELLARRGLRVLQARDGEEALATALKEHPWLIVTDTRMPRLDGFELCRRVRSHSFISSTPIVFLSGWDDYKDRHQAMELGANDYLSKNYSVRELLIRMHLILTRLAKIDTRERRGMRGSIDSLGSSGLLQLCHMTRLSGLFLVRSGTRHIEVRFKAGEIIGAASDFEQGVEAVYELLSWTRGSFEFKPGESGEEPRLGSFSEIIIEGCRRSDASRSSDA